jgi:hypothetical protein
MLRKFLTVGFGVANPIGLLLVKALVVAAVVKLEIVSLYISSLWLVLQDLQGLMLVYCKSPHLR